MKFIILYLIIGIIIGVYEYLSYSEAKPEASRREVLIHSLGVCALWPLILFDRFFEWNVWSKK